MKINNVLTIRSKFEYLLRVEEYVIDKTGKKTLEIINASFIADQPSIFGVVNEDYIERELNWYNSTSLNVYDIEGKVPAIWQQVADANGFINSNYGWCIYSKDNHEQYLKVKRELKRNPDSRRATMIYTRPTMHEDYNKHGMSDFMCTNTVQYLIRDDRLNALVYMRSNDAVYGYKNDYAWQKHVLDKLSADIEVKVGNLFWNVASLHVYENHFELI